MPRKLKFYQRKGEKRRIPDHLRVSIPLDDVDIFTVSISLEDVVLSPSYTLSDFHHNIVDCRYFPANWSISPVVIAFRAKIISY